MKHITKASLILIVVITTSLFPMEARAEFQLGMGGIKGYMFAEYYYILDHNNADLKDRNGFWFRRIYVTYNNKLSDNLKMRFRIEMNSPGDFTSKDKLTPVVKDAYLSYTMSGHELKAGIIPTPTKTEIEKIWGYRSVEKTPLDLQKMLSSRDFGIALKGHLDSKKKIFYNVMFGNGAHNRGETDKGKKIYGALSFKPIKGLFLEVYGDYETQNDEKTYYVYQGFVAYEDEWGRVGVLYANRHFKQEITAADDRVYDYRIFSVFAVVKVIKNIEVIVRYDKNFGSGFEGNYSGHKISYLSFADNSASNLLIGGISWQAYKNVWLIPNIKYVFYDEADEGDSPSDDVYANLTLWFKF